MQSGSSRCARAIHRVHSCRWRWTHSLPRWLWWHAPWHPCCLRWQQGCHLNTCRGGAGFEAAAGGARRAAAVGLVGGSLLWWLWFFFLFCANVHVTLFLFCLFRLLYKSAADCSSNEIVRITATKHARPWLPCLRSLFFHPRYSFTLTFTPARYIEPPTARPSSTAAFSPSPAAHQARQCHGVAAPLPCVAAVSPFSLWDVLACFTAGSGGPDAGQPARDGQPVCIGRDAELEGERLSGQPVVLQCLTDAHCAIFSTARRCQLEQGR